MNTKLYKQQWPVQSKTDETKEYKVSLKHDGTYVCSCPHNIFRKIECEHIKEVKAGVYDGVLQETETLPFVLANVAEVTVGADPEKKTKFVQIPLCPLGDTHFQVTIVYDLLKLGYNMKTEPISRYGFKPSQKLDIIKYVSAYGRKIYGKWVRGQGHVGFKVVKV